VTTPAGTGAAGAGAAGAAAAGARRYQPADVSRALLIMISNNIGQLAYLNALQHRCADVYFAGNFLRHENTVAMRTLAYSIRFWSKGQMDGLFLRHEGYCGALGAFLMTLESAATEVQRAGEDRA
jgi:type II pantothenate kinase